MNRDPAATPYDALAERLMAPARSGACMTKNELVVLARLTDASLRISERKRMLVDVLRSARDAAELEAVISRLAAFWRDSLAHYETLVADFPTSAPLLQPWSDKARETLRSLDELAEDVRREAPEQA